MSKKADELVDLIRGLGDVVKLREALAVQASHVERLLSEKRILREHARQLASRIDDLERVVVGLMREKHGANGGGA